MNIVADLAFEVLLDADGPHPTTTTGRVRADGSDVTVELSQTPSLLGSGTRPAVRPAARTLDEQGVTVHLVGPSGPVLHVGRGVRAPWWQVPATGSRFVRLASVPLVLRSLRGPRLFEVALPPLAALPSTALAGSRRRRLALTALQLVRRVTRRRR